MPNLERWIEAQLKRGYTKQQIKKAFIRRGYPQKAAAEVDRIASSYLPRNPPKKPVANKLVLDKYKNLFLIDTLTFETKIIADTK